jgi:uncharacterized membrane protein
MDNSLLLKTILIMPIVDFLYLGLISSKFKEQILDIQKTEMVFRLLPTIVCYIALVFALNYFILNTNNTREQKILNAFLLGLCIYAVYETTNYATIQNWKLDIVLIDTLWGGLLFAITTFLVTLKF